MKKQEKILYEQFHKSTRSQQRIITANNFTFRIIISVINKYIKKKSKILDIGCGAGTVAFYLANRGHNINGIDISKAAIDACIQSSKLLNLAEKTSFRVMKFPNQSPKDKYNVIICSEIIEHIKDDEKALKIMHSLLKPKGIVILSTPSSNAPLYKLGLLKSFDKRVGHERRYSLQELLSKSEKAGFRVIETHKTEGAFRNLLFTNKLFGQFVRVVNKFNLSNSVTVIDNTILKIFGESQLFVILKK